MPVIEWKDGEVKRERMFNREYFDGGTGGFGGYAREGLRDFPCHEITFRHIVTPQSRHLAAKPVESVLEIGCARGYILKRLEDHGIPCKGLEISKHCYLTRVSNAVVNHDICETPWPVHDQEFDLCFSIATMEHIPEEFLPAVIAEMGRTCKRGLHGIDFGDNDDGFDKTHCSLHEKAWWEELFAKVLGPDHLHEIRSKEELEQGNFPPEVLKGDGKLKLNIGSFTTMFHHGWINIDVHNLADFAGANGYQFLQHDVNKNIPFGTGDVDLIFCSHMLEHLTYNEARAFLKDCRRVLKPTGVMRFLVPSAGHLIGRYDVDSPVGSNNLAEYTEMNNGVADSPTDAVRLWNLLCEGHKAIYDHETLFHFIDEAGFHPHLAKFRRTEVGEPGLQILRETTELFAEISLIMEAVP